jgi:hypothetical protein
MSEALVKGDVTSTQLTQAHLDRINDVDSSVKAFLHVDAEGALAQASRIDADRSAGKKLHPLAGIPLALKDVLVQEGIPTTAGSKILQGWKPQYDSTVVSKIKEAGIVILGKAKTNRTSEPTIEGGIGRPYGGTNDADNSGILKYVRIEYAGIAALPNSEINALTLGGVGSGTVIENVQTIYANDDAFEFFGGTVSPKNLYAFATADDDFDFDFGYTGTITNGVSKRDPQFVDNGDAGNGIECDNDGVGSSAQPFTHPKLNGMVLVGPFDAAALANHNLGLRWRRATQFTITNSKILGYQKGSFSIESNETAQAYKDGVSKFENNEIQAYDPLLNFRSTSTLFTAANMKEIALSQGNREVSYTKQQMEELSKPSWINNWTRFPAKGN